MKELIKNLFLCWLGFILALIGYLMRVYYNGFDTLCLCFSMPCVIITFIISFMISIKTYKNNKTRKEIKRNLMYYNVLFGNEL